MTRPGVRHVDGAGRLLLAAAVLLGACTAHRPASPDAGGRDELERRHAGFLWATDARNADGIAGYFAEDAVLHVAGMPPVRGRADIVRFHANVFRFLAASTTVPEVLRMSDSADMAYGAGRVQNAFDGPDGLVEYEGKYAAVWERRDGEWYLALYAVSSDAPESGR
jgi:ketosteroid isomerase-like protein